MGISASSLLETYAGRRLPAEPRPTSARVVPGRDISPVVARRRTARGDRGSLAVLTPGHGRVGEGPASAHAPLPNLYDHTPRSLKALGRVVAAVAHL